MSLTDITGTFLRVLLNFRERDAIASTDHPMPTPPLPPLSQQPLNQIMDQLWSGIKDTNNKTLRDRTQDEVVAKLGGVTNLSGSFPASGNLEAGVGPASFNAGATVGNLFLVYGLPGESFTFNTGLAAWRLDFDMELEILIDVQDQPGRPLTANAKVKITNANVSATNFAASSVKLLASFWFGVLNSVTGVTPTLSQLVDGAVNQTTGISVDSLNGLLGQLASAFGSAFNQGFLHLRSSLDANGLFFRLTHPLYPAPVVTDATNPSVPFFQGPVLVTSRSQIDSGEQLLASGRFFSDAHTTSLHLEWGEIEGVTESEIEWTPSGGPTQRATKGRQPNDHGSFFTVTGVAPATTFQVRVRDCDQLTCSDWSAPLAITTAASDEVDITLQSTSSGSVLVATVTLGADGSFSVLVTIPAGTSPGAYNLRATVGGEVAIALVRVLGLGQAAQPVLTLIDHATGTAEGFPTAIESENVTVGGEGFAPGLVQLVVDTGQQLGAVAAPGSGIFVTNVFWPAGVLGNRRIIASQVGGGITTPQASLSVLVQPLPR